jgi:hypothetical protein
MDPEAEILMEMSVGCCGENEALDAPQVWEEDVLGKDMKPSGAKRVRVSFPAFSFLDSCRKYAAAVSEIHKGPWCPPKKDR